MKKPAVTISSLGEGGNIFAILAKVYSAMRQNSLSQEYNRLKSDVMECKTYDEAIVRIKQDVDLIDTDGRL